MSVFSKVPKPISGLKCISLGATSVVYQLNANIVIKYRHGEVELFEQEKELLRTIKDSQPPDDLAIVQCFYSHGDLIFLQYLAGHTLDQRYSRNRIEGESRVIEILDPLPLVSQWIYHLARAIAYLEGLGFVHGDLAPRNVMVSPDDRVTLIDFDCAERVGDLYAGGGPPFNRILNSDEASLGRPGSFGFAGPRTEQFALGSLLYLLTRGLEPFAEMFARREGAQVVDLLQQRRFPPLDTSAADLIIHDCWHNRFPHVSDLADRILESLRPALSQQHNMTTDAGVEALAEICRDYVDKELSPAVLPSQFNPLVVEPS